MKKTVLFVAVLAMVGLATAPLAAQCGIRTSVTLFGGQTIDTGRVIVENDAANLYITYVTNSPWEITAVHLAVAGTLAEIPQNRNHNPLPGHFPTNATLNPPVTAVSYTIPLGGFNPFDTIYIAAQAEVQAPGGGGGSQTAWGDGPRFGGHNWATYISYTVQSCNSGE